MDLKELGFTKEELQDRIVERCCEEVLGGDQDRFEFSDTVEKRIREEMKTRVDEVITRKCEEAMQPIIDEGIAKAVIQITNQYGEAKGEALTLKEYLVKRANDYLMDNVDRVGKTKTESNEYGWRADQTRVCFLLDQYMGTHVQAAMKEAVADLNQLIIGGIEKTVQQKLKEISENLSVAVSTRR